MKKIVSIMLAVLMMLSVCSVAFAADETTPVIVVSGLNSFPLYLMDNDEEIKDENQVFPPSAEGIVKVALKSLPSLAEALAKGDWNAFADGSFESIYADLFEVISCDKEGNPVHKISTRTFDGNVGNHQAFFKDNEQVSDEVGIIRGIIDELGEENVFFFNYDWRLDPLDHADELNDFIKAVKSETGSQKVTLVPASMGGTVVNSYLYKYGSDGIEKIIYCEVASRGLDLVGELFGKNIEITTDMLLERLFNFEKSDIFLQALIGALYTGAENIEGLEAYVDSFVKNFVDELSDRAYEEVLFKSFATMPGMWAFCPDSYYENDKEVMFGKSANGTFINKIDSYHYNVQKNNEKLMNEAIENGVQIYIIAAYGYVGFPVTSVAWEQSDCLIETKNESFGAVCAPYGEHFEKDYKALGTVCGEKSHNHVSVDGIVDASSCSFPEQTWFIKNNRHVGLDYATDCTKLLMYFINAEEQLTVHSSEEFPQFVSLNLSSGKFTSLTGEKIKPGIMDKHSNILLRLLTFVLGIFEKLKNLI